MAFVDAVLQYHGTVSVAPNGGPWTTGTVPTAEPGTSLARDFVLVRGWLGAGATMLCPTQLPVSSAQPDYGCGSHSWLTDDPWPTEIVSVQPPGDPPQGIRVQNDAYDAFALDPLRTAAGASPRQGTFLVQWTYVDPCPGADCFVAASAWHWRLVYRIDPWPGATPSNAVPACQSNDPLACSDLDGFPIGRLTASCGANGSACTDVAALVQFALGRRVPGHPPIAQIQQFDPDMARVCGQVLCAISGTHVITVITFADGSHRPVGYECPGVLPCRATFSWGDYAGGVEAPPLPTGTTGSH
jgi:hypothetical protein